jgi:hypothetical protein
MQWGIAGQLVYWFLCSNSFLTLVLANSALERPGLGKGGMKTLWQMSGDRTLFAKFICQRELVPIKFG